jgi:diguanylate cyclase (GGDEF)-like protein/PAS domain S-box-containing protein
MGFDTEVVPQKNIQILDYNQNVIVFEDKIEIHKKLELLYLLIGAISNALDFNQALNLVLEELCQKTGWVFGEAWVPNQQSNCLECSPAWYAQNRGKQHQQKLAKFRQHSETFKFRFGEGLPGKVWAAHKPIWFSDASQEPHFVRSKLALKYGLGAAIGVPIIADRHVVTVLVFFMGQPGPEDQRFVLLLSTVATQLGNLFRQKQIEQEIKAAEFKYRNIYENAIFGIFQSTQSGQYLNVNPALAKLYGYDSPQHLIESIVDLNEQIYVQPGQRDRFIQQLQENDVVSHFISQVYHRSGKIIWISEHARVVRNEQGQILYYEGMVEDITYRIEAEHELYTKVYYDSLTKLPNRALFMNQLLENIKQVQRNHQGYQFALLFLDLDRFKVINDSLGHFIGDKLLEKVARKLEACIADQGLIARIGGDEFTIILEGVESQKHIQAVAEQILQVFKSPFEIEGHRIFTGTSIGIVLSSQYYDEIGNQLSCITPEGILRDADIALHQVKRRGKNHYQIFDTKTRQQMMDLMVMENDLRQAIAAQEFRIHYQPIMNIKTGSITGFEALIRWQHPQQGLIFPDKFIELAEDTGLIIAIGYWILKESCRQLKQWRDQYPHLDLTMNVNLSLKQLTQSGFVSTVLDILHDVQIPPQSLKLEITESHCAHNEYPVITILEDLKQQQIQLCIDDFGTGYSSLNYLHSLPIQVLKIDKSYVEEIESDSPIAKVAQMILTLAQNLGLKTVAEGIETLSQLTTLQEIGCDFGQGYLLSRPVTAAAIDELLANTNCLLNSES